MRCHPVGVPDVGQLGAAGLRGEREPERGSRAGELLPDEGRRSEAEHTPTGPAEMRGICEARVLRGGRPRLSAHRRYRPPSRPAPRAGRHETRPPSARRTGGESDWATRCATSAASFRDTDGSSRCLTQAITRLMRGSTRDAEDTRPAIRDGAVSYRDQRLVVRPGDSRPQRAHERLDRVVRQIGDRGGPVPLQQDPALRGLRLDEDLRNGAPQPSNRCGRCGMTMAPR